MIPAGEVEEGIELWLKYRPWLQMRVAIRGRVNKRRARLGKPPLPPFTKETLTMLPNHVVSWTGIGAVIVGAALHLFGVDQCTAAQIAAGVQSCVDPSAVDKVLNAASDILVSGGGIVTAIGKVRSMKREAALTAQVAATPAK